MLAQVPWTSSVEKGTPALGSSSPAPEPQSSLEKNIRQILIVRQKIPEKSSELSRSSNTREAWEAVGQQGPEET